MGVLKIDRKNYSLVGPSSSSSSSSVMNRNAKSLLLNDLVNLSSYLDETFLRLSECPHRFSFGYWIFDINSGCGNIPLFRHVKTTGGPKEKIRNFFFMNPAGSW